MEFDTTHRRALGAGAILLLALTATPGLMSVQAAQAPAQSAEQVKRTFGQTTVTASVFDFDLDAGHLVAEGKVDLVSGNSHLVADKMTVQFTPKRDLEWAKCEGNVVVERKNDDGTQMTARSQTLNYREREQKADLAGNVLIKQDSPRLAKPGEITGARVEMDLATRRNVVFRGPDAQAKAHVEPKGEPNQPKPEPIDLIADRLESNGLTQEYIATGKPMMVRPTSKLQAKRIRFEVDEKTNEVKVAYAENDVIFDGQGQKGTIVHATGDQGIFDRQASEIVLTGLVQATTRDAADDDPIVYKGDRFVYNTTTRKSSLKGTGATQASVVLPPGKVGQKKPDDPAAPAAAEKTSKKDKP